MLGVDLCTALFAVHVEERLGVGSRGARGRDHVGGGHGSDGIVELARGVGPLRVQTGADAGDVGGGHGGAGDGVDGGVGVDPGSGDGRAGGDDVGAGAVVGEGGTAVDVVGRVHGKGIGGGGGGEGAGVGVG